MLIGVSLMIFRWCAQKHLFNLSLVLLGLVFAVPAIHAQESLGELKSKCRSGYLLTRLPRAQMSSKSFELIVPKGNEPKRFEGRYVDSQKHTIVLTLISENTSAQVFSSFMRLLENNQIRRVCARKLQDDHYEIDPEQKLLVWLKDTPREVLSF